MAHVLDFTTGRAGIAYTGDVPWHGLGQQLSPGAPLETWMTEAGLEWEAKRADVKFDKEMLNIGNGKMDIHPAVSKDHVVLYRSDSGAVLSIVSPKYQPVQPREVIEFYRDLTEKFGYELETAGSLKDGSRIWALANTKNVTQLRGGDIVKGYLLLATSFDGSMATQARFTSIRVVCNNTLEFATASGKADVVVPHSTKFDADKVKVELNVGEAWEVFAAKSKELSSRIVDRAETARFFLDVYFGLDSQAKLQAFQEEEGSEAKLKKFINRLNASLFDAPGVNMESSKNTAWGLVNAVTHDVDFVLPSRNQGNRLNKAWFGTGAAIKRRAWDKALALVA